MSISRPGPGAFALLLIAALSALLPGCAALRLPRVGVVLAARSDRGAQPAAVLSGQIVVDWTIGAARRDRALAPCLEERESLVPTGPCDDGPALLPPGALPEPLRAPVPEPYLEFDPMPLTLLAAALLAADPSAVAPPPPPPAVGCADAPGESLDSVWGCWSGLFARDPSVGDVQRWAAERVRASPEDVMALVNRARGRAALPLIRLRGRFTDDQGRDWDEVSLLKGRSADTQYVAELWLEWDLAELGGGGEELRAVREGRALVELRQAVVHEATVVYFDRRRVVVEQALDSAAQADAAALARAAERALRRQELDATLDALTGGRWSRALGASRADPDELP